MRLDKLADFRTKIDTLDINEFRDGFRGDRGNLNGGCLRIKKEQMPAVDGAQPPCPAGKGFPPNFDAIGLKQHHKLFKYSLFVHRRFKKEQEKGRYIISLRFKRNFTAEEWR